MTACLLCTFLQETANLPRLGGAAVDQRRKAAFQAGQPSSATHGIVHEVAMIGAAQDEHLLGGGGPLEQLVNAGEREGDIVFRDQVEGRRLSGLKSGPSSGDF